MLKTTYASWIVLPFLVLAPRFAVGQEEPVPLMDENFVFVSDEEEIAWSWDEEPQLLLEARLQPATDAQPETTTDEETEPAIPEIPETTVIGRPESFPSRPLAESTLLTPTRTEAAAGTVGSSVSVVTEQQISVTHQTKMAEVLRSVPGLDVVQQGGPGGLTSVFLRGANSQHTKVLIDGIPVNDPSSASRAFNFSHLSIDNIERVEVLRGPQSTLYGSDAIGGVVNIITKRGEGPLEARASFMGGSYGTSREAVNLSGGTPTYHYSFGASYLQSDGFSAGDLRFGNQEKDGLRDGTLSGRFGWTPSDCFDVDYVFRYNDLDVDIDDLGFGNGVPPTDNLIRQNRSEAFFNRVQMRLALLDGLWEQKVGFNLTDYDRLDTDPGFWGIPRFQGQARQFDYQSNFILTERNTLTVGVDYLHEDARSTTVTQRSQYNKGIYFQDQFRLADRWFTTAGFRWDDHSAAGPASTYRVTTLYRLPYTETAFHGSIGTGFRAPALAENFFPFGNPNLRPEKSQGWDCGLQQPLWGGRTVVDVTYFRNDFTDLIQFDFNTFTLENIGRAFSSGVEVTAIWYLNQCTTLSANYVHTFTEDLETGLLLRRRPQHTAWFAVNRRLWSDRANVNLNLFYVGPRLDSSDSSVFLDEYYLLNLAGSYDLNDCWQLFVRVDNLLDEDYEQVFGFDTPALSVYAGANLRW